MLSVAGVWLKITLLNFGEMVIYDSIVKERPIENGEMFL